MLGIPTPRDDSNPCNVTGYVQAREFDQLTFDLWLIAQYQVRIGSLKFSMAACSPVQRFFTRATNTHSTSRIYISKGLGKQSNSKRQHRAYNKPHSALSSSEHTPYPIHPRWNVRIHHYETHLATWGRLAVFFLECLEIPHVCVQYRAHGMLLLEERHHTRAHRNERVAHKRTP